MVKKKDDIPDWVTDEIQNAKFKKPEELKRSGYVLEVYDADNKIDAQLYDPVEDGRHILGFKEGDSLDMPIRGHAYNVYAISTDKGVALIDGDNCSFLVRIKGLERTSENKVEKESDIKVEYKHDKPYGIRDKTGYLLFFRSIDKYEGQEERYKEEVEEMKSLAEDISKYLKVRHSQA